MWRDFLARRQAVSAADLDELEDYLREQIADRRAAGLNDEEAFLVAIKRLGNLDAVSREFAREHLERLSKHHVLLPQGATDTGTGATSWRDLTAVISLAVGAGLALKAGLIWLGDGDALVRSLGLLIFPFLGHSSRGNCGSRHERRLTYSLLSLRWPWFLTSIPL